MIADPYKHFLDVSDPDDPLELLAISPEDARNPARIEAALYQRMMATFRKRAGHGPDAERVRWRLRAAAEALKNSDTEAPTHRPIKLSEIEDALRRMLGVSGSADPFTLLGLPAQPSAPATIDGALLVRVGQTYDHPAGRGHEADIARNVLRAAARSLKNRMFQEQVLAAIKIRDRGAARHPTAGVLGRPPVRSVVRSPAPLQLTQFDRQALAILVGNGGWNHASRARLVGLSSTYGVSVAGLIKVINGLSDYAKSGGPRLGTAEITSGEGHLEAMPVPPRVRVEPDRMERIVTALDEKFSRAFAEDSAAARVRLSIGFGVLTIFALLATVWALTRMPDPATPRSEAAPNDVAAAVVAPNGANRSATGTESRQSHVLRFPYPPTFSSRGLPVEAINAADACPVLLSELDDVLRRLTISADPAEAVYRRWMNAVQTLSTAWVLLDESTRMEVQAKLREVLASVEGAVQQRLWDPLLPISPHRTAEPLDLWRGSWLAGMLTELGHRSTLPPTVVERARTQIRLVLPGDEALRADDFESGAGLWLEHAIAPLVAATELDEDSYDHWELWLAAVRKMPASAERDGLLAGAVQALLETPTDLARPGPSTNVLGRILQQMDFRTSVVARDRILSLFDNEAISADDLWVLTSVLVQLDASAWFDRDLVVPYDADMVYRRRTRDRIADRWPPVHLSQPMSAAAQGRGLVVDADDARRWRALLGRIDSSQLGADPETLMRQLVAASLLNKAAAMLGAGEGASAVRVMDTLDSVLSSGAIKFLEAFGATAGERPGQSVGKDGVWSETFELARKNHDEVLTQLRQLRATAGTDLGPIDAATLVREAYRGGAQDIRAMAQATIGQSFTRGPNVVIELLDQMPGAPRTEGVSDMLEQITGDPLPRARSATWPLQARRSLVRHALRLHEVYDGRTDRLAAVVTTSYAEQAAAARREAGPATSPSSAADAARDLAVVLMQRASQAMTANPVPDDLPGLQRRDAMRLRLAEGPVQRFVATQVAVLELMAYVTVAERPASRERVSELLAESTSRRGTTGHVLRQSVEAERAISRIWNLRITESDNES